MSDADEKTNGRKEWLRLTRRIGVVLERVIFCRVVALEARMEGLEWWSWGCGGWDRCCTRAQESVRTPVCLSQVQWNVIEKVSNREFWNTVWIVHGEQTWCGCVWLEREKLGGFCSGPGEKWGQLILSIWVHEGIMSQKPFREQRSKFNRSSKSVLSLETSVILHLKISHVNLFCWLIVLWRDWTHSPLGLTC